MSHHVGCHGCSQAVAAGGLGCGRHVSYRPQKERDALTAQLAAAHAEVARLTNHAAMLEAGYSHSDGVYSKPAPFVGYEEQVDRLRKLVGELVGALQLVADDRGDWNRNVPDSISDLMDRARAAVEAK